LAYRLDALPDYAFPRLHALLAGVTPRANIAPLNMSIGEPTHPIPEFMGDILARNLADYGKYPPNGGTPELLDAISDWILRRYGVRLSPHTQILPLNGTREGLFNAALALVPISKAGQKPAVLMPNPFYQCYAAAALSAGADPIYVAAGPAQGFLPDFAGLNPDLLARTALIYLCSPANPQGAVASRAYLAQLIDIARHYKIVLALDECYSEIYTGTPPSGGLEVAGADARNVLVFHSLSKRSNLPGLRSGFVAGDGDLIAQFRVLKNYGGAPLPLPIQAASAAIWRDEAHVEENRALYRQKFDIADRILGNRFGYHRPDGGFFAWLNVGDGEAACVKLWRDAAIKILPGAYLAQPDETGANPGRDYIRVALVADANRIEDGLTRILACLEDEAVSSAPGLGVRL
jgi:aspartate/methionine/tyrosine aminotransferase